MDLLTILINSLWAGLFAGGMGFNLTAPSRYIVPAFLCGFIGRFVRDVFMSWGMSQNWSTAVGAAVVVLAAVAFNRRHVVSPVVLISGVLPLGATVAMFNAIIELIKVSSLQGDALNASSLALIVNTGKVFTSSLAIAVGLGVGTGIVRFLKRHDFQEGV